MTLNDIFPGRLGRLDLARVMLKLTMPELARMPMDEDIPDELAKRLQQALREVKKA